MKKRTIILSAFLILLVGVFAGCGNAEETDINKEINKDYEKYFAEFSAEDIYGKTVTQNEIRDNKYTLITVWGTYCSPCIDELPDLQKLYDKYRGDGINVLGVVIDIQNDDGSLNEDQNSYAQEITDKQGVEFVNMAVPPGREGLFSEIAVTPTAFFIDGEGNVIGDFYEGAYSYEEWSDMVEKLLEE
ncbi:MAG TPA: TlpA disulfide reductase family protein [Bacillota bacterium]|nr:TlpA disulfide reductase family protein [Bacillota bacterium]HUM56626.1 TlpA disulfide reductase family protein [Bacillota bacterium]